MASSIMKWVLFFLALLQVFRSASAGALIDIFKARELPASVELSKEAKLAKAGTQLSKEAKAGTQFHVNDNYKANEFGRNWEKEFFGDEKDDLNTRNFNNKNSKDFDDRDPSLYTNTTNSNAKDFGLNLAKKNFGDKFIKGFRWGRKLSKRVLSVARKCDKLMNFFESLCNQTVQSTVTKSAIEYCIVEISSFEYDKTCVSYDSNEYPPEATCILDQPDTLGSKNCTD